MTCSIQCAIEYSKKLDEKKKKKDWKEKKKKCAGRYLNTTEIYRVI